MPGVGYRLCTIQPNQPWIFGRLHQRIHGLRCKQRQPSDPAAFPAGSDACEYPHCKCAASFRAHTGHDLGTGGSWLVASESTVDRTDSGNDKTVSSGGKPAHTRLQHQLRGLERTGGYRGCYSRCGRPVQCRTATSSRPIRNQ